MKAMILAAGFGTRLRPLTLQVPKPMVPILNRPILEHTIHLLRSHGINEITINLHHLPEVITDHFGDGSDFGVKLNWSHEPEILGTAGGIKKAQPFLEGETFLVINSDVVVDIDLSKIISDHKARGSALTLVVREGDSPEQCDPIEVNENDRIVHMVGASSMNIPDDTTRVLFTGIQVMEPEIFDRIPANKFYGTTTDVFPGMLKDELPLFAAWHTGYWKDIGTVQSYLDVHQDLLNGRGGLPQENHTPSGGHITPPVLIGKNCTIADTANIGPYVVLGDNCTVGDHVVVEHSICWNGATLGRDSQVKNSVLGNKVTLAEKTRAHNQTLAQ
ncbi:MAG: NTP transferase domain-containing protein [Nitrospinaceae bacterium]|nr:NDP-sugar synthase [Nitrospinaceae bacterium]NIR55718.1 NDP-sugar synthase [Nitrospinaceae bacterium]NIS86158.1 NDP-sugar synthase [Nitrospinaceae bacterium]NIT80462.1 NDP-sugar synthase [Nitrospinaceae bacterium]NIU45206.1 NDP-sugar synthase [Nitrospinaceae bacterium]